MPRKQDSSKRSQWVPANQRASSARVSANRANAQQSTGPRTPQGKTRSSQNAVKHGLFSRRMQAAFVGSAGAAERAEYDALLQGLRISLQPRDETEETIVDCMADHWWQLAELRAAGAAYLRERRADNRVDNDRWDADLVDSATAYAVAEARVLCSLTRLQRNLLSLQRWRSTPRDTHFSEARKGQDRTDSERGSEIGPLHSTPIGAPKEGLSTAAPDSAAHDASLPHADSSPASETALQMEAPGFELTSVLQELADNVGKRSQSSQPVQRTPAEHWVKIT